MHKSGIKPESFHFKRQVSLDHNLNMTDFEIVGRGREKPSPNYLTQLLYFMDFTIHPDTPQRVQSATWPELQNVISGPIYLVC